MCIYICTAPPMGCKSIHTSLPFKVHIYLYIYYFIYRYVCISLYISISDGFDQSIQQLGLNSGRLVCNVCCCYYVSWPCFKKLFFSLNSVVLYVVVIYIYIYIRLCHCHQFSFKFIRLRLVVKIIAFCSVFFCFCCLFLCLFHVCFLQYFLFCFSFFFNSIFGFLNFNLRALCKHFGLSLDILPT